MRRISIVGTPGSGKSTVGRELAERLGVPYFELDSWFHEPGWTHDADRFRAAVTELVAGGEWVIDGNYSGVRDLVWGAADGIVWLDRPRWLSTARVLRRTVRRIATRQKLWNGNRESWRNLVSTDPEHNVVLWSWTRHPLYAELYGAAMDDPALSHLERIRLRSDEQIALLLREVETTASEGLS